jgi:hypothetical protein
MAEDTQPIRTAMLCECGELAECGYYCEACLLKMYADIPF